MAHQQAPAAPQQWGPPSGGFPGPGGPGGPGGSPPGLGAPPPGGKAPRSRARIWIAVGVVALLVIGAGAWFVFGGAASAQAAQVQLEATSTAGPSPFTAPVGEDTTGVVAPANAQGAQPGNTGGLYAQDPAKASCDTASLVNQISADPAKASAWAKPLGIDASGIGGFVSTLSAVTLRADTAVTEYGYRNGQFQPYPAVLQAGTAALVNSYGEPTVKCYNGDPLGAPTASNSSTRLVGLPWNGFVAERTIVVTPAPVSMTQIVVVNPGTNTQTPKPLPPNPDPKPNPGSPTDKDGKLLLTGTPNYDGTITLSDGTVIGPDNKPIANKVDVNHPAGSTILKDGAIQEPPPPAGSGLVFNKDGTERRPITTTINGVQVTIAPDGTATPLQEGTVFNWNYDGTVTTYKPGATSTDPVVVPGPPPLNLPIIVAPAKTSVVTTIGPDGKPKVTTPIPVGGVAQPDGSIKSKDGKVILNPSGTPRTPQEIPGGVVVGPDGSNTPPKDAKVDNKMAGTDGTLGTENQQVKQGQPGQAQPGEPAQPGGAAGTPKCVPGTAGAADPACAEVAKKKQPEVCTPDPATGVCPVTPEKPKTGTSTEGTSTSGTGTGSGTSTSGTESGSGSTGSGSGSSGSGGSSGSSGESGGSTSGG